MGKKLVRANTVEEYVCCETKKIYVDDSLILAPGAKDWLRNNGIGIVYGPKPEAVNQAACCSQDENGYEQLISIIVEILKKDFGITDTEQLVSVSSQVIKALGNLK